MPDTSVLYRIISRWRTWSHWGGKIIQSIITVQSAKLEGGEAELGVGNPRAPTWNTACVPDERPTSWLLYACFSTCVFDHYWACTHLQFTLLTEINIHALSHLTRLIDPTLREYVCSYSSNYITGQGFILLYITQIHSFSYSLHIPSCT